MKEVTPFRVVHPVQGETRKVVEPDPSKAVDIMPIMSFNPLSFQQGIRNFGPQTVVEEAVQEEAAPDDTEGDVGPKAVTSSATDSASDSGSASELTQMLMHPSTPLLDPESPASAVRESSPSGESPETKSDGWPMPLALG